MCYTLANIPKILAKVPGNEHMTCKLNKLNERENKNVKVAAKTLGGGRALQSSRRMRELSEVPPECLVSAQEVKLFSVLFSN